MKISISLAQMDLKLGAPENNILKAQEAVIQASMQGAEIVLLPELWASGFDLDQTQAYASSLDEGWFTRMRTLAVENRIGLGGSMIEESQGQYYNTFVLYDKSGDLLGAYRKIHLFQKLQEHIYFAGGEKIVVVDSPWGKVGLAICYDLRFVNNRVKQRLLLKWKQQCQTPNLLKLQSFTVASARPARVSKPHVL